MVWKELHWLSDVFSGFERFPGVRGPAMPGGRQPMIGAAPWLCVYDTFNHDYKGPAGGVWPRTSPPDRNQATPQINQNCWF